MPSFHYHLKFELYATPDPTSTTPTPGDNKAKGAGLEKNIWVPGTGTDSTSIFDDLPSHPRAHPFHPSSSKHSPSHQTNTQQLPVRQFSPSHQTNTQQLPVRQFQRYPEEAIYHNGQRPNKTSGGVIDCGASRANIPHHSDDGDDEQQQQQENGNIEGLSEGQWRARSKSFPPPGFSAGIGPRKAVKDWRFGRIRIESFDFNMAGQQHNENEQENGGNQATPAASLGPNLGGMGLATKAKYIPLETKNTEAGWGIVHLYREGSNTNTRGGTGGSGEKASSSVDGHDEGTILCIPAVPRYLSPSDFLNFVGEKWRGDVSHYRMIMTERLGRYMVLMKFRDNRRATEWRREFDGKAFDKIVTQESEICHVTFIKSITFETPNQTKSNGTEKSTGVINSSKPFPPPTPDLTEMPTCTVCLERMDDTAGLMTILCQHVFHCTCLQTWKGSGCPVCRATNPKPDSDTYDPDNPYSQPFGSNISNICSVCNCTEDLWICLICGKVGCGRYKGGHAKDHWKETAHSFSLELETQYVWDYAGDMWVHRLIRDKGDGKIVELPSGTTTNTSSRRRRRRNGNTSADQNGEGGDEDEEEEEDVVPRAKLENIGLEYTHLMTSQLESQRIYFEEMVNKAADKAAKAAAAAESAGAQAQKALQELATLREEHRVLKEETVPQLERDLVREKSKASKSTELARNLSKSLQEEKQLSKGLMERIEYLNKESEATKNKLVELQAENEEVKETNRDLAMFISGQEKLKELEDGGKIDHDELVDGSVSVPEEKKKGKGKGKAKR